MCKHSATRSKFDRQSGSNTPTQLFTCVSVVPFVSCPVCCLPQLHQQCVEAGSLLPPDPLQAFAADTTAGAVAVLRGPGAVAGAAASRAAAPDFSQDIWRLIIQHVPLSDRLGSCSLVSRLLHTTAVEVTQSIAVDLHAPRGATCFQYIQQHGNYLTSLHLSFSGEWHKKVLVGYLPCQHLQELKLQRCDLQLGDYGGDVLGVFDGSSSAKAKGCVAGLDVIGGLTDLVHLCVGGFVTRLVNEQGQRVTHCNGATFPVSNLPALTKLTNLELAGVSLQGFNCLSILSRLSVLCVLACFTGPLNEGILPTSLCHIELENPRFVHPSALAPFTHLTVLHLHEVSFATPSTARTDTGGCVMVRGLCSCPRWHTCIN